MDKGLNITQSYNSSKGKTPIIFNGYVVSNIDQYGSGELKVRIDKLDSNIADEDLAPAFPMLPLYINIIPKIGERVRVMFYELPKGDEKALQSIRLYFPVVSQYQNLESDPYHYSANSTEPDGFVIPEPNPNTIPDAIGIYPSEGEISLAGRQNTDLLFKDSEVLLRAGKYEFGKPLKFNSNDPAYIQVKYGTPELTTEFKNINVSKTIVEDVEYQFDIIQNIDESYTITVYRYGNEIEIDTFNGVLLDAKNYLRNIIISFPKYYINTNLEEFNQFPKYFENRTKIVNETTTEEVKEVIQKNSGSVVNIVANKINLISHKATKDFAVGNQPNYISPEEQIRINSEAHPLVYGDVLLEFLQLIQKFVATHVHPFATVKPAQGVIENRITGFPLDTLISNNIRLD